MLHIFCNCFFWRHRTRHLVPCSIRRCQGNQQLKAWSNTTAKQTSVSRSSTRPSTPGPYRLPATTMASGEDPYDVLVGGHDQYKWTCGQYVGESKAQRHLKGILRQLSTVFQGHPREDRFMISKDPSFGLSRIHMTMRHLCLDKSVPHERSKNNIALIGESKAHRHLKGILRQLSTVFQSHSR